MTIMKVVSAEKRGNNGFSVGFLIDEEVWQVSFTARYINNAGKLNRTIFLEWAQGLGGFKDLSAKEMYIEIIKLADSVDKLLSKEE